MCLEAAQPDKGQLHIRETTEDTGDPMRSCTSNVEEKLVVCLFFYDASNLHLTHDLCSLKGGSGVHVSRPKCPGLNKDQGFSLLPAAAERRSLSSRRRLTDPAPHPHTVSPNFFTLTQRSLDEQLLHWFTGLTPT